MDTPYTDKPSGIMIAVPSYSAYPAVISCAVNFIWYIYIFFFFVFKILVDSLQLGWKKWLGIKSWGAWTVNKRI